MTTSTREEVPEPVGKQATKQAKEQAPKFFSSVFAIVWKDLTMERHTRQLLSVMLVFSLTAVIVYSGSKLIRYGDLIAERTGLSRTWRSTPKVFGARTS